MSKKKSKPPYGPLTDAELNVIRGKTLVHAASPEEILRVFGHLDYLHDQLDDEAGDSFGTEGWRRGLLGQD